MEKIIIIAILIVAVMFALAGIIIGFWTAVRMICEAREERHIKKSYPKEVDWFLDRE